MLSKNGIFDKSDPFVEVGGQCWEHCHPDTDSDKRDADGNNASYWAQQLQHEAVLQLSNMPPPAMWSFEERRAVMDAARAAMAAGKSEGKKGKKKGKKGGKKKGKKKKKK